MLHLAYIANIRLPTEKAHGLQIMKTCEALANQGVEVELIVPRRRNYSKADPFYFYGVRKNFKITRLGCVDFLVLPFLKRLGFWLAGLTFYWAAKSYLAHQQFDAYYTRDLFLAAWFTKIFQPLFYEIHTLPERPRFYHALAWQRAKKLIVISDGLKKDLINYDVPESKIAVVRDAVDVVQFDIKESKAECRQKLGLPLGQKIVLYTGHLYEWKGATTLAQAAQFLSPNINIYIVGGTPGDIARFRRERWLPQVHIVGWQPHEFMPFWQRAADLLALPNSAKTKIGAFYTSPLKLFEYALSGTPIVASDVPAIREVLGTAGAVYFEPDNSRSLAEGIRQGLEKIEELRRQAQCLRERIAQTYTWERRAALINQAIFGKR